MRHSKVVLFLVLFTVTMVMAFAADSGHAKSTEASAAVNQDDENSPPVTSSGLRSSGEASAAAEGTGKSKVCLRCLHQNKPGCEVPDGDNCNSFGVSADSVPAAPAKVPRQKNDTRQ